MGTKESVAGRTRGLRPWLLAGATALGLFPVAGHASGSPDVQLEPNYGKPASALTAAGSGFTAYVQVDLWWDDASVLGVVPANQNKGSFQVKLAVPRNATAGTHYLCARYHSDGQVDLTQSSYEVVGSSYGDSYAAASSGAGPAPAPSPSPAAAPAAGGQSRAAAGTTTSTTTETRYEYVDVYPGAPAPASAPSAPPQGPVATTDIPVSGGVLAATDPGPATTPDLPHPGAGNVRLTDQVFHAWMVDTHFQPDSPLRFLEGLIEWIDGIRAGSPTEKANYELQLANKRLHEAQRMAGRPALQAQLLGEFAQHLGNVNHILGSVPARDRVSLRAVLADNSVRQQAALDQLMKGAPHANTALSSAVGRARQEAGVFATKTPPPTLQILPVS
ncbi:MAG: DUF5667 domain-containing protein [Candidatus Dormibacteria bacterium]